MSKKINKKKNARNNFKVEALEPRLMMDAEPLDPALESNLDIQQFDSYVEQIGSLSEDIGDKAVASLGQFDKIDFTQFHLADKANAAIEFVGDSAEQLKSVFADKVNTTLGNALKDLEKKYYVDEVTLEEGKIKLADFVQNYVAENAEGTGLTFAVEGSKLVVNYDIEYAKNITDMGFDLAEGKLELTSEGTALNTSAKFKAVIDLDKGGNGIILDETSDVGDFAVSVEELKISVDNLGMKAKFMNVVLEEVDKEGEDGPDLSISYASGSDVSQSVNLEFGLANSGELPFEFKDGELLTLATVDGTLEASIPDIQMKEGSEVWKGVFNNGSIGNLPFIGESTFGVGSQKYTLPQLVEKVNDLWTKVSIALTSTVEPVQFYKDRVQLNLSSLRENLQIILGDSYGEWTELLDKLMVKAVGNGNEFYSLIGEPTEALHLMNLKDEAVLSFVIAPKSLSLESLDIGLTSLEGLSADIALAFNVKVNVKDDSSISFAEVSLDDFSLKMGASLTDSNWGPVQLNGVKFNYDVKIDSDNDLQQNVAFDYESVDLVVNGNTLYSSASGSITCANPGTDEQKWSLYLDKGIVGDLPFVFEESEVTFSKVDGVVTPKLPEFDLRESFSLENAVSLLSSVKIPFINSDITEKITSLSSCWNKIVMAIQGAMEQGSDVVTISCEKLSALLAQFDKDETVKSALRELDLKYGENSFNLLADNDDDLTIQLKENADNVFALEFKVNSETLSDRLDFGVLELDDVAMDIAFSMNVKVHVAKPGDELQANICEVTLDEASVHLTKSDITHEHELEFGKFKVDIKEGNLDLGIKIDSQMKVSFDENSGIDLENFKISFESFEVDNLNSSIVCNASEDGSQVWSLDLSSIKGELNDWPITISDSALKVCCDKGEWKFEVPSFEWNDSFSIVNSLNTLLDGLLVELPESFNLDIPLGGDSTVKLSNVAEVINESFLDTFVLINNANSAFDVDKQLLTLDLSSLKLNENQKQILDKQKQILSSLEISVAGGEVANLLDNDSADKPVELPPDKHTILLSFVPNFGQIYELDLGFTKLKEIDISAKFNVEITLTIDDEGNCTYEVDVPDYALDFYFSQGDIKFGIIGGSFNWGSFSSIQDFSMKSVLEAIGAIPFVNDFVNKEIQVADARLSLNDALDKVNDSRKLIAFVLGDALTFGEGDSLTLNVEALKNNHFLNDKINDIKSFFASVELVYGTGDEDIIDLLELNEIAESPIALNGTDLHVAFKLSLGNQTLDLKLFKLDQTEFGLTLDCSLEIENKENKAFIKKIDVSSVGLDAECDEISLNVGAASATLSGCNFNVSASLEDESVSPEIKLAYGSADVEILSETHNIVDPGEFFYSNGGWNIPDAITGLVEGFNIGVDFSLESALSALKNISNLPLVEEKIPNVSQIVKSLDEKWNPILQSIRSAVNEGELKLEELRGKITVISGIGDVLSGLVVNGNDLLSGAGSDEGLDLSGLGGKLEVTLVPNIDLAGNDFTFDFLGKDICLKLDASLEITLELGFEITEDNKPSFESLSLKKATLSVTGSLDEGVEFSLGLVGVSFAEASLEVKLEVGDSPVKVPEVSFDLTGTELKVGGVAIKQFENLEFGYKQGTGEWEIPDELKQFMSFSGENMVQQVHMYLNTLQTALRNLVESKTKLDFLDGSIDKVVDICDKVEQLVYGFSEGTDEYGLLKCDEGRYVANFEGVDDFVTKFNDAWAELFFQGAEDAPTVCSMSYVYKVDGEEPIEVALKEDGSFDGLPDGAEFIGNRLVFNLSFNLGKEFELNFAKSLSSFDVASVLTSGYFLSQVEQALNLLSMSTLRLLQYSQKRKQRVF